MWLGRQGGKGGNRRRRLEKRLIGVVIGDWNGTKSIGFPSISYLSPQSQVLVLNKCSILF